MEAKHTPEPWSDDVMEALRQRRDLEPDDTSEDGAIRAYSPRKAFKEWCEWNGLIGYARTLHDTLSDIYGVNVDAAPDMLDALKDVDAIVRTYRSALGGDHIVTIGQVEDAIRAAIDKAEGGTAPTKAALCAHYGVCQYSDVCSPEKDHAGCQSKMRLDAKAEGRS